jgi:hypothetical protein
MFDRRTHLVTIAALIILVVGLHGSVVHGEPAPSTTQTNLVNELLKMGDSLYVHGEPGQAKLKYEKAFFLSKNWRSLDSATCPIRDLTSLIAEYRLAAFFAATDETNLATEYFEDVLQCYEKSPRTMNGTRFFDGFDNFLAYTEMLRHHSMMREADAVQVRWENFWSNPKAGKGT